MSTSAVNWGALGIGASSPPPPTSTGTVATGTTTPSVPWYESLPVSLANAAASIYSVTQAPAGTEYVPTANGPIPVQQQTITSATWLPWLLIGGGVLVVGLFIEHSRRRRL